MTADTGVWQVQWGINGDLAKYNKWYAQKIKSSGFVAKLSHHGEQPQASRSKLLAKRPHGGGHGPGKKLNNVGEISGSIGEDFGKTSDI